MVVVGMIRMQHPFRAITVQNGKIRIGVNDLSREHAGLECYGTLGIFDQ